jgi:hypothetical protein
MTFRAVLLTIVLLLAGCTAPTGSGVPVTPVLTSPASASPSTATESPSAAIASASDTAETPAVRTIEIVLKAGRVSPNGARVDVGKGEEFVLSIRSDRADEIHVHGFDLTIPVKAGGKVTRRLVADQRGRFEVESHHPALVIVILQVR